MFFPHPRFRRRVLSLAIMPLSGLFACAPTADSVSERHTVADSVRASEPSRAVADTDDFGAPLPTDAAYASRVVSLNPTATEVIFAIGAQSRLVGRSNWDEFPAAARTIAPLGDGIRPNVEAILSAKPSLVILYASAENRAAAEALARSGVRTITLRVDHIAQFVSLTRILGIALDATPRAQQVADSVQRTIARVRAVTARVAPRTVAWPLWQQPVMVVGRGSYLDELIEIAGGRNVFHDLEAPSPVVNVEEIARRDPDVLIASARTSAELLEKPQWQAIRAVRQRRFVLDDPTRTGRPSVVLGMAAASLARLLHPELASALDSALAMP